MGLRFRGESVPGPGVAVLGLTLFSTVRKCRFVVEIFFPDTGLEKKQKKFFFGDSEERCPYKKFGRGARTNAFGGKACFGRGMILRRLDVCVDVDFDDACYDRRVHPNH